MVGVGVGVDDVAQRLAAAHLGHRIADLAGHLGHGRVEQQSAFGTRQHHAVAAAPAQQIDAVAEVGGLDLDLAPVGLLPGGRQGQATGHRPGQEYRFHGLQRPDVRPRRAPASFIPWPPSI